MVSSFGHVWVSKDRSIIYSFDTVCGSFSDPENRSAIHDAEFNVMFVCAVLRLEGSHMSKRQKYI